RIVGTYRLIRGIQVEDFYSSSEFDINQISKFDGPKVELSRACIQKSYRNGSVIALLWRGICEYVHTSGACWLFGLGSIRSTVPGEIAEIYKHLTEEGAVDPNLQVPAVNKYLISNFKELVSQAIVSKNARESIPPLLRSYLKLGAVLGSDVALDLEFNCADLFVVLDVNKITASFSKRFQVH
ncbi:MAG: GNAT family N-acetyltransferase, partial [Proteobacteria bacterium]|nr:GNAT family N-acetyltransferase [Pseudomonadota bacterium]